MRDRILILRMSYLLLALLILLMSLPHRKHQFQGISAQISSQGN